MFGKQCFLSLIEYPLCNNKFGSARNNWKQYMDGCKQDITNLMNPLLLFQSDSHKVKSMHNIHTIQHISGQMYISQPIIELFPMMEWSVDSKKANRGTIIIVRIK